MVLIDITETQNMNMSIFLGEPFFSPHPEKTRSLHGFVNLMDITEARDWSGTGRGGVCMMREEGQVRGPGGVGGCGGDRQS